MHDVTKHSFKKRQAVCVCSCESSGGGCQSCVISVALGGDDSCVEPSQDKRRGRVPLTSSLISDAVCYIFVGLLIDWIVKVVSTHDKSSGCLGGNLIIVVLPPVCCILVASCHSQEPPQAHLRQPSLYGSARAESCCSPERSVYAQSFIVTL